MKWVIQQIGDDEIWSTRRGRYSSKTAAVDAIKSLVKTVPGTTADSFRPMPEEVADRPR